MRRFPILTLSFVLAATTLIGCGGEGGDHADHAADAPDAASEVVDDRYTVRGEITAFGSPDGSQVFIHHEAIPDFRSAGEVVGMDSMTMGFAVATDVPADGLEVGDKIEFEWVLGTDDPAGSIVRIERLDPETELDFDDGQKPDATDGGGAHDGHDP